MASIVSAMLFSELQYFIKTFNSWWAWARSKYSFKMLIFDFVCFVGLQTVDGSIFTEKLAVKFASRLCDFSLIIFPLEVNVLLDLIQIRSFSLDSN